MSLKQDTRLRPNFRNFDRHGRLQKIEKPNIVGYFSVGRNREFIPNESNCKYLKIPPANQPIHLDLNEGYGIVERKVKTEEKLDHLLKFILLNLKKLMAPQPSDMFLQFDVICFRGKLRLLMCTPYEFREGWSLLATKFKGNIYICEFETDEEKHKRQSESELSKKICSYGFKFEQYVMSDSPTSLPVTDVPVIESEEFCCMFTTQIGGMGILYGAEMDGIESDTAIDFSKVNMNDLNFTEVKVRIKPTNQRQVDNFNRFKTRNWWCQSHLTNVQKIVVGLRTESGIVDEIETVYVDTLPKINKQHWSSSICLEFLSKFLNMVKDKLSGIDCPHTVYKFDYDPKKNASIQCTIYKGPNKLSFLPDWYTNEVEQHTLKKPLL